MTLKITIEFEKVTKASICNLLWVLLITCSNYSFSQAPGGVEYPVVWKKSWVKNGQGEVGVSKFNFHPYRYFSNRDVYEEFEINRLDKFSLFVVFSSEGSDEIGKLQTGNQKVVWEEDKLIGVKPIELNLYEAPQLLTYIQAFPSHQSSLDKSIFLIGSSKKNESEFRGGVSELIIYDKIIGKKYKDRIESYLSIKYGLSLPLDSDYYNSFGDVIRSSSDHGEFIHRVTMIGRDDGSGLYQKQSHNLYDKIKLTIGLESLVSSNMKNQGRLEDQSFLMWADNNAQLTFVRGGTESLLSRKWQLKGFGAGVMSKRVEVSIDVSEVEGHDISKDLLFVVDNHEDLNSSSFGKYFLMAPAENGVYKTQVDLQSLGKEDVYFTFVQSSENKYSDLTTDFIRPNPVMRGEYFTISSDQLSDKRVEIRIINAQGKLIKSELVGVDRKLNWKGKILFPGVYFIQVKGKASEFTYKMIVQ